MPVPEFSSFEAFWPYYVRAHTKPLTRALHYLGTGCAIGCLCAAILTSNPWLLFAAPVVGYGSAWAGHFAVERNQPATFGFAAYSMRADFKMLSLAVRGRMRNEVDRCCRQG